MSARPYSMPSALHAPDDLLGRCLRVQHQIEGLCDDGLCESAVVNGVPELIESVLVHPPELSAPEVDIAHCELVEVFGQLLLESRVVLGRTEKFGSELEQNPHSV